MTRRETCPPVAEATTLEALLDQVWDRLAIGRDNKDAPARCPTLATVGLTGRAEARSVVLRGVDRAEGCLILHTDLASEKVAELRSEPRATLHIWDGPAALQMRFRVDVFEQSGKSVSAIWGAIPDAARQVYGGTPYPGYAIADPSDHQPEARADRFGLLDCMVIDIEVLHIGAARHRRAIFRRSQDFNGQWLAP